ncbi:MAG: hypothetical protein ABIR06_14645 [Cyclobacteriaceae bacterium]
MVSDLTTYDSTQRICSAFDIEPEFVYLHNGTTAGAKNLGIKVRGKEYLQLSELPGWLTSSLGPADIENFLCIYKDDFSLAITIPRQKTFVNEGKIGTYSELDANRKKEKIRAADYPRPVRNL